MDGINFIDPTISSDSDEIGDIAACTTQEVRRSINFKSMLNKYVEKSSPNSGISKKIFRNEKREPARKLTSLLQSQTENKVDDIFKKKVSIYTPNQILKYGSIAQDCNRSKGENLQFKKKVKISSELALKVTRTLTSGKVRPILKIRNRSLPNVRMFENMKSSWYPQPAKGDCSQEELSRFESRKRTEISAMDENKVTLSNPSKNKLNSQFSFGKVKNSASGTKRSASVKLTIKLTYSKSIISSDMGYQTIDKLNRIDTIINPEELLMANEDFVRYLAERHKHVTGYRKQTCQPISSKKTIVKLAFSNTLNGT